MMTLPAELEHFMQGQDLNGLKPFALLYRNKWNSTTNKYELESTPIDISDLIVKPNTLSMTLDVNEVAQYNANNVTLTLADTKNYFVEGTPNSYFPDGYQLYGSRVVLYYGLDGTNRTPLFTGVIKDLPTHKPEQYQVELKLVSPLEMLKDIEAKDFSDKVTGETLTYKGTDSDGHRIYWTSGTGVGGFDAVYANGTKLFEGVDYETDQLNALGLPAIVTIINSSYYSSTIKADYYTWKTGLTVEQIVAGLAGLAGYDSGTEDIRNVIWNTEIKTSTQPNIVFTLGYQTNGNYSGGGSQFWGGTLTRNTKKTSTSLFPNNFIYELTLPSLSSYDASGIVLGEYADPYFIVKNGFWIRCHNNKVVDIEFVQNADYSAGINFTMYLGDDRKLIIEKNSNNYILRTNYSSQNPVTITSSFDLNNYTPNVYVINGDYSHDVIVLSNQKLIDQTTGIELTNDSIAYELKAQETTTWSSISASKTQENSTTFIRYRTSENGISFSNWTSTDINSNIGVSSKIIQFSLGTISPSNPTGFRDVFVFFLDTVLTLQLVNLSDSTVLEALQDFSLISGYEFGVDRQGVFFFRPRVQSTTPQYVLDHDEIVKIDTVKKNLNDFFTKLTLTFAQRPLEFYANTGDRPTLVDKYGIINKEIDKPDIVNYDNPELAQAIGPQLLETYSSLTNTIQAVCKINLALELGDIVSLRRNMNLITPDEFSDYTKYTDLNTYYRACKIVGLNYNFSKRQITYTLRDVSNKNTEPGYEFENYIYDLAVPFGVKE